MHLLPWRLLVLLLVAGTSLSVDVNQLTQITKEIVKRYGGGSQFCLAENFPNQWEKGRTFDQLIDNAVYAYSEKETHAEPQVLTPGNLETLKKKKNPAEFLLIYSYLSPCTWCTWWGGVNNIVDVLYKHVSSMKDAVFVFTEVYKWTSKDHEFSRTDLEKNLNKLSESMGGLEKVYRCYQPTNLAFACYRCSSATQGKPAEVCVEKFFVPVQGGSGGGGTGGTGGASGGGAGGASGGGAGGASGGGAGGTGGASGGGAGRGTGGSGNSNRDISPGWIKPKKGKGKK